MSTAGPARDPEQRRAELVAGLAAVRSRIAAACERAGRDPREVTMVAVTKTYPAADVVSLALLGVGDIGENRDQEAAPKVGDVARELTAHHPGTPPPRWHFVGQLQSRKCRAVAGYAHAVHSIDRPHLVERLAAAMHTTRRAPMEAFIQVSLDGAPGRGGAPPEQVDSLADAIEAQPTLRLRGVMAVAPIGAEPSAAFATLAGVSRRLRERYPHAADISAGMSGDLEAAIENGATYVRVGSALLGPRRADIG